jgi:hypothetical protein
MVGMDKVRIRATTFDADRASAHREPFVGEGSPTLALIPAGLALIAATILALMIL